MDFLQSTNNASQSSSSELWPVESEFEDPFAPWPVESEGPFAPLAKEVESIYSQTVRTYTSLWNGVDKCLSRIKLGISTSSSCLSPPAQFSRLTDDRSRTSKYCRFSFNTETGLLIAKVLPKPAHELAIRLFDSLMTLRLHDMHVHDEVLPFGSTTVEAGKWKKEADSSWAPASTNMPSFVVEVGLSESKPQLARDAHGWLTHSSSVIVVTISIKRNAPDIILCRWEVVPRAGVHTRSSPLSPRCTAVLKLSRTDNRTSVRGESYTNGTTTTTIQLDLPFHKVAGHPPHRPSERDIVIHTGELRHFAEHIWKEQCLL
ncbi:unnamed protein product [Penicillium egyptiacum]|uniref:Uncharacterized protein n=1 Tax=Penicillium egyptiacum TaxID=1303716 RepID=A0A9W4P1T7_9EURO|nr:unnamed protein product [Penicillium egyptiacum]